MEKKNAVRLSEMERTQMETNKRLDDVLKSNTNLQQSNTDLQNMLQTVLSTITSSNGLRNKTETCSGKPVLGDSPGDKAGMTYPVQVDSGTRRSSGRWRDVTCSTSDDLNIAENGSMKQTMNKPKTAHQVNFPSLFRFILRPSIYRLILVTLQTLT